MHPNIGLYCTIIVLVVVVVAVVIAILLFKSTGRESRPGLSTKVRKRDTARAEGPIHTVIYVDNLAQHGLKLSYSYATGTFRFPIVSLGGEASVPAAPTWWHHSAEKPLRWLFEQRRHLEG